MASLPRLPLPKLEESCKRYLESLCPLLSEEELRRSRAHAEEFQCAGGVGEQLQRELEKRKAASDAATDYPHGSWLEAFWDHAAYLDDPQSLLNVNFFGFGDYEARPTGRPLLRAARMIAGMAAVAAERAEGKFAPDFADRRRTRPMCMFQYSRVLGATRVPGDRCDELQVHADSRHVAVCCRDRWFEVQALTDAGAPLSTAEVLWQLEQLSASAEREDAAGKRAIPTAALTALPRRRWAQLRRRVLACPTAAASLRSIETALFLLSLDPPSLQPRTLSEQGCALQRGTGASRWFDKACQLVVFADGRAGFAGDHSAADAPVPSRMLCHMGDYVLAEEARDVEREQPILAPADPPRHVPPPRRLSWDDLQRDLREEAGRAEAALLDKASAEDFAIICFCAFGKDRIKAARCSPDGFVQVALQVAQRRDQGRVVPTYETASSRAFFHGRTETCRALTAEVKAFVEIVDSAEETRESKLHAFEAAIKSNRRAMQLAVTGRGFDRHLLALYLIARESPDRPLPALFQDPAFQQSSTYLLSTSQMTSPWGSNYPAFPVPYKEGYGVCYSIFGDEVHFSVSAKHVDRRTSAPRFARHVGCAMKDLLSLVEGKGPISTPSRL